VLALQLLDESVAPKSNENAKNLYRNSWQFTRENQSNL